MNRFAATAVATMMVFAVLTGGCSSMSKPQPQAGGEQEQLLIWADADPDSGAPPLEVKLTVDPLEDIDDPEYDWDFGDGSDMEEGAEVTHTYQRGGMYKARARVRDSKGNVGEDSVNVEVEADSK